MPLGVCLGMRWVYAHRRRLSKPVSSVEEHRKPLEHSLSAEQESWRNMPVLAVGVSVISEAISRRRGSMVFCIRIVIIGNFDEMRFLDYRVAEI